MAVAAAVLLVVVVLAAAPRSTDHQGPARRASAVACKAGRASGVLVAVAADSSTSDSPVVPIGSCAPEALPWLMLPPIFHTTSDAALAKTYWEAKLVAAGHHHLLPCRTGMRIVTVNTAGHWTIPPVPRHVNHVRDAMDPAVTLSSSQAALLPLVEYRRYATADDPWETVAAGGWNVSCGATVLGSSWSTTSTCGGRRGGSHECRMRRSTDDGKSFGARLLAVGGLGPESDSRLCQQKIAMASMMTASAASGKSIVKLVQPNYPTLMAESLPGWAVFSGGEYEHVRVSGDQRTLRWMTSAEAAVDDRQPRWINPMLNETRLCECGDSLFGFPLVPGHFGYGDVIETECYARGAPCGVTSVEDFQLACIELGDGCGGVTTVMSLSLIEYPVALHKRVFTAKGVGRDPTLGPHPMGSTTSSYGPFLLDAATPLDQFADTHYASLNRLKAMASRVRQMKLRKGWKGLPHGVWIIESATGGNERNVLAAAFYRSPSAIRRQALLDKTRASAVGYPTGKPRCSFTINSPVSGSTRGRLAVYVRQTSLADGAVSVKVGPTTIKCGSRGSRFRKGVTKPTTLAGRNDRCSNFELCVVKEIYGETQVSATGHLGLAARQCDAAMSVLLDYVHEEFDPTGKPLKPVEPPPPTPGPAPVGERLEIPIDISEAELRNTAKGSGDFVVARRYVAGVTHLNVHVAQTAFDCTSSATANAACRAAIRHSSYSAVYVSLLPMYYNSRAVGFSKSTMKPVLASWRCGGPQTEFWDEAYRTSGSSGQCDMMLDCGRFWSRTSKVFTGFVEVKLRRSFFVHPAIAPSASAPDSCRGFRAVISAYSAKSTKVRLPWVPLGTGPSRTPMLTLGSKVHPNVALHASYGSPGFKLFEGVTDAKFPHLSPLLTDAIGKAPTAAAGMMRADGQLVALLQPDSHIATDPANSMPLAPGQVLSEEARRRLFADEKFHCFVDSPDIGASGVRAVGGCTIPVPFSARSALIEISQSSFSAAGGGSVQVGMVDYAGTVIPRKTCAARGGFDGRDGLSDKCYQMRECSSGSIYRSVMTPNGTFAALRITVRDAGPRGCVGALVAAVKFSTLESQAAAPRNPEHRTCSPTDPAVVAMSDLYCAADRTCIPIAEVCDGVRHCSSQADEELCKGWRELHPMGSQRIDRDKLPPFRSVDLGSSPSLTKCRRAAVVAGGTLVEIWTLSGQCAIFTEIDAAKLFANPSDYLLPGEPGILIAGLLPDAQSYKQCSAYLHCTGRGAIVGPQDVSGGGQCNCACQPSYSQADCSEYLPPGIPESFFAIVEREPVSGSVTIPEEDVTNALAKAFGANLLAAGIVPVNESHAALGYRVSGLTADVLAYAAAAFAPGFPNESTRALSVAGIATRITGTFASDSMSTFSRASDCAVSAIVDIKTVGVPPMACGGVVSVAPGSRLKLNFTGVDRAGASFDVILTPVDSVPRGDVSDSSDVEPTSTPPGRGRSSRAEGDHDVASMTLRCDGAGLVDAAPSADACPAMTCIVQAPMDVHSSTFRVAVSPTADSKADGPMPKSRCRSTLSAATLSIAAPAAILMERVTTSPQVESHRTVALLGAALAVGAASLIVVSLAVLVTKHSRRAHQRAKLAVRQSAGRGRLIAGWFQSVVAAERLSIEQSFNSTIAAAALIVTVSFVALAAGLFCALYFLSQQRTSNFSVLAEHYHTDACNSTAEDYVPGSTHGRLTTYPYAAASFVATGDCQTLRYAGDVARDGGALFGKAVCRRNADDDKEYVVMVALRDTRAQCENAPLESFARLGDCVPRPSIVPTKEQLTNAAVRYLRLSCVTATVADRFLSGLGSLNARYAGGAWPEGLATPVPDNLAAGSRSLSGAGSIGPGAIAPDPNSVVVLAGRDGLLPPGAPRTAKQLPGALVVQTADTFAAREEAEPGELIPDESLAPAVLGSDSTAGDESATPDAAEPDNPESPEENTSWATAPWAVNLPGPAPLMWADRLAAALGPLPLRPGLRGVMETLGRRLIPADGLHPVGGLFGYFGEEDETTGDGAILTTQKLLSVGHTAVDMGHFFGPGDTKKNDGATVSFWLRASTSTEGFVFALASHFEDTATGRSIVLDRLFQLTRAGDDGAFSSDWFNSSWSVFGGLYVSAKKQTVRFVSVTPPGSNITDGDWRYAKRKGRPPAPPGTPPVIINVNWQLDELQSPAAADIFNGRWHHLAVILANDKERPFARLSIDGRSSLSSRVWRRCLDTRLVPTERVAPGPHDAVRLETTGTSPQDAIAYSGATLYAGYLNAGLYALHFQPVAVDPAGFVRNGTRAMRVHAATQRSGLLVVAVGTLVGVVACLVAALYFGITSLRHISGDDALVDPARLVLEDEYRTLDASGALFGPFASVPLIVAAAALGLHEDQEAFQVVLAEVGTNTSAECGAEGLSMAIHTADAGRRNSATAVVGAGGSIVMPLTSTDTGATRFVRLLWAAWELPPGDLNGGTWADEAALRTEAALTLKEIADATKNDMSDSDLSDFEQSLSRPKFGFGFSDAADTAIEQMAVRARRAAAWNAARRAVAVARLERQQAEGRADNTSAAADAIDSTAATAVRAVFMSALTALQSTSIYSQTWDVTAPEAYRETIQPLLDFVSVDIWGWLGAKGVVIPMMQMGGALLLSAGLVLVLMRDDTKFFSLASRYQLHRDSVVAAIVAKNVKRQQERAAATTSRFDSFRRGGSFRGGGDSSWALASAFCDGSPRPGTPKAQPDSRPPLPPPPPASRAPNGRRPRGSLVTPAPVSQATHRKLGGGQSVRLTSRGARVGRGATGPDRVRDAQTALLMTAAPAAASAAKRRASRRRSRQLAVQVKATPLMAGAGAALPAPSGIASMPPIPLMPEIKRPEVAELRPESDCNSATTMDEEVKAMHLQTGLRDFVSPIASTLLGASTGLSSSRRNISEVLAFPSLAPQRRAALRQVEPRLVAGQYMAAVRRPVRQFILAPPSGEALHAQIRRALEDPGAAPPPLSLAECTVQLQGASTPGRVAVHPKRVPPGGDRVDRDFIAGVDAAQTPGEKPLPSLPLVARKAAGTSPVAGGALLMRAAVLAPRCPVHGYFLLPREISQVTPVLGRRRCCVVESDLPCTTQLGILFQCPVNREDRFVVDDETGAAADAPLTAEDAKAAEHVCAFAICEHHMRHLPLHQKLVLKVAGKAWFTFLHNGWWWAAMNAVVMLAVAIYAPILRTCFMIAICHPQYQCEFEHCWPSPDSRFFAAFYTAMVVLVVFGLGFPLAIASALRGRTAALTEIFKAPAYGGRYLRVLPRGESVAMKTKRVTNSAAFRLAHVVSRPAVADFQRRSSMAAITTGRRRSLATGRMTRRSSFEAASPGRRGGAWRPAVGRQSPRGKGQDKIAGSGAGASAPVRSPRLYDADAHSGVASNHEVETVSSDTASHDSGARSYHAAALRPQPIIGLRGLRLAARTDASAAAALAGGGAGAIAALTRNLRGQLAAARHHGAAQLPGAGASALGMPTADGTAASLDTDHSATHTTASQSLTTRRSSAAGQTLGRSVQTGRGGVGTAADDAGAAAEELAMIRALAPRVLDRLAACRRRVAREAKGLLMRLSSTPAEWLAAVHLVRRRVHRGVAGRVANAAMVRASLLEHVKAGPAAPCAGGATRVLSSGASTPRVLPTAGRDTSRFLSAQRPVLPPGGPTACFPAPLRVKLSPDTRAADTAVGLPAVFRGNARGTAEAPRNVAAAKSTPDSSTQNASPTGDPAEQRPNTAAIPAIALEAAKRPVADGALSDAFSEPEIIGPTDAVAVLELEADRVGDEVTLEEWSRFNADRTSVLASLYDSFVFERWQLAPLLLFFKIVLLAPPLLLAPDSLPQMALIATGETAYGLMMLLLQPYFSSLMNVAACAGTMHQLVVVGLQTLTVAMALDSDVGKVTGPLMLLTSVFYCLFILGLLAYAFAWPVLRRRLVVRRTGQLLARLGQPRPATLPIYVDPSRGAVRLPSLAAAQAMDAAAVAKAGDTLSK